jgi:hypothetical protein
MCSSISLFLRFYLNGKNKKNFFMVWCFFPEEKIWIRNNFLREIEDEFDFLVKNNGYILDGL